MEGLTPEGVSYRDYMSYRDAVSFGKRRSKEVVGKELEEEEVEEAREGVDDEEGGQAEESAQGELVAGGDGEADGAGVAVAQAATSGACGEVALPSGRVEDEDGGDADDAAEKSAEEDGEEGSADAEERANHGHHFDVAHAHAIAVTNEFIESGGGEEEEAAERGA